MFAFTNLRLTRTVATALAASLALSACNKANDEMARSETAAPALPDLPATLPLASGAATPVSYAPGPSELPDTRAIPAVRTSAPGDAYAYADQAYGFMDALGDAPPDYGFDYDGVDPWAWQGYDDSVSFAEPIDGGYRYYYYRPGAEEPYFIRDPRYGYGYDDGQLAVVYATDGAVVPYESYGPQIGYASRYYVRGRDLWRASRANPRRGVIAANWVRQRPQIVQSRTRWQQDRPRQPLWVAYHQSVAPRQDRHWQPEQIRREADARRYANWQREDFRTPPPPRAIPVRWQQASWAKDTARFAPAQAAVARYAARRTEVAADRGVERGLLDRLRGGERARVAARPDVAQRAAPIRREAFRQQIAETQAGRRETMAVVRGPQRAAQARARDASRQQQATTRAQREQAQAGQVAQREQMRRDQSRQVNARREARQHASAQNAVRAEQQQARNAARVQADRAGREQAQAAQARAGREQARAARTQAGQQQARAQARAAQQAQSDQARQAQQAGRAQAQAARAQAQQARAAQPPAPHAQAQRAPQPAAARPQGGGNPGGGHPGRGGDRGGQPHRQ